MVTAAAESRVAKAYVMSRVGLMSAKPSLETVFAQPGGLGEEQKEVVVQYRKAVQVRRLRSVARVGGGGGGDRKGCTFDGFRGCGGSSRTVVAGHLLWHPLQASTCTCAHM